MTHDPITTDPQLGDDPQQRATGTPTWIDLGSADFATAKTFYEQLFGWRFHDAGEAMGHYHMVFSGEALVGGAMDTSGMTGADGQPVPNAWSVYLAVDDCDARTKRTLDAGAQAITEPHDAGAAGRFSMVLDPTGAVVGLWQAGDTGGFAFTGEAASPVWFELMSQDAEASNRFYSEVFDFDLVPMSTMASGTTTYWTNGAADAATSGICDVKGFVPAELGSFWRAYIRVANCDEAVQRVHDLGGSVLDGPTDSPFGRLATIADPSGATLQVVDTTVTVGEGLS